MPDLEALRQLLRLIGDDSHAMTFQSLGQYRTALLVEGVKLIKQAQADDDMRLASLGRR